MVKFYGNFAPKTTLAITKQMTKMRLNKLISFLKELEKLKLIERRVLISNRKRRESAAEHSWDLAMWVWLLSPDLPRPLNIGRSIKLALMHDLVEIYAGDTFFFDHENRKTKTIRENKAAKKLFAKLPSELKKEFEKLWLEFEAGRTKEVKVVSSIDKLQPILQNILSGGTSWKKNRVTEMDIYKYKQEYMLHDRNIAQLYNALIQEAKRLKLFNF